MILLEDRPCSAECWIVACDVCGYALDAGSLDAPDGGWETQRAAYNAAESHGWAVDVHGVDLCPEHAAGLA